MTIATMKILDLCKQFVPESALDSAELDKAKEMQALLLAAHEHGVDEGKDVFDRLRKGDRAQLDADLRAADLNPDALLAQNLERIGVETIPAEVPAIAQIARVPQDAKTALLMMQGLARLESLKDGVAPDFQEPRIFRPDAEKGIKGDPPLLTKIQEKLLDHMKAGTAPTALSLAVLRSETVSEINALWARSFDGAQLLHDRLMSQGIVPVTPQASKP